MCRAIIVSMLLVSSLALGQEPREDKIEQESSAQSTRSAIEEANVDDSHGGITASPTISVATPAVETQVAPSESLGLTYLTAWSTFALAVITGSLAIFTYLLFRSTKDLVKETQSIESPFLIPEVICIDLAEDKVRPMVTYTFKNHGRTPAIIRRFQDRLRLLPQLPDDADEVFEHEALASRPGQYFALGPVQLPAKIETRFLCRLADDDLNALQNGKHRFYLVGRVEYEDLAERTFEQGFCVQIVDDLPLQHIRHHEPVHYLATGDTTYNYRREPLRTQTGNT